ncbi:MAG: hypothetical protein AB8B63_19245 [Granulosicoccus sp.]
MSIQELARTKKRKGKSESRFQRLWAEAEALASENTKLESSLDSLVQRIDRDVLSVELSMGQTIREVVYKQLGFARKKSLLKWQRDELNDWISENLLELDAMGLIDEPLENEIAQLRAYELGIELDPDSDKTPAEQLDEFFHTDSHNADNEDDAVTLVNNTSDLFDDLDAQQSASSDDDVADVLHDLFEEFEAYQQQLENSHLQAKPRSVSPDVFMRLFRQTAAALHPDRESDEEMRMQKHELMSQLLKARKDNDLITIMQLHEQFSPSESALDSDDHQALEAVLLDYLEKQRQRRDEITGRSPMHRMVFDQFYHKNPATITRRINAHLKQINKRHESLHVFMGDIKTLKRLKEVLDVRYNSHLMSSDWF